MIQSVALYMFCTVVVPILLYLLYCEMEERYKRRKKLFDDYQQWQQENQTIINAVRSGTWREEYANSELVLLHDLYSAALEHVSKPTHNTLADLTIAVKKVEPIIAE